MPTRREFIRNGTCVAATSFAGRSAIAAFEPPIAPVSGSKPNIILILADDMGFSDIGCFGSEISTPNLDRLASRGIRISQFYNNPRCCPSRASIMTGLYSQQAGMGMMTSDYARYPYPGYVGDLSAQTLTVSEALKSVGYNTAMVGKWHLTPTENEAPGISKHNWPLQRGFDKYWGMISGSSVYFNSKALVHDNDPIPMPGAPESYLTDLWAEHAVSYVDELAKTKNPFFLYCAFNAPHWPLQAPEDLIQKYSRRYAGGWDALREERHQKQISMGVVDARWPLSPRDPRVPAWDKAGDKEWEMRRMAVYAAMIDRLDEGIGRILAKVEETGIAENTLILFMSDNGGNAEELGRPANTAPGMLRGNSPNVMPGPANTFESIGIPWGNCANTPFRLYKHYTQEGGISTPFIACWPKVIQSSNTPVNAVGHETDLMPTFLEISGAKYPDRIKAGPLPALAGESLVPIFAGKSRDRAPIYWEHEGNRAVRDGRWKLVSRYTESWELHDMEADRTEMRNLAQAESDRVKTMSKMYDAWANRVGVQPWPMPQTPQRERGADLEIPPYLKKG
jgi:arylsulfatase A-like enzyme